MPGTKQPIGFVFLFFVVLLCQCERPFCVNDFFVIFFLPLLFTILTRSCDLLLQVRCPSPLLFIFAYKNMTYTFHVTVIYMLSRFGSILTSTDVVGQCTFMKYTCILFSSMPITNTMVSYNLIYISVHINATNIIHFIYICILNSIKSMIFCNVIIKIMYLKILKNIKHTYNRFVYQYLTILSMLINLEIIEYIAIVLIWVMNITMTKWYYIMIFRSAMFMYVISASIWQEGGHPMTLSYLKYIIHQICCSSCVFSENVNNQLLTYKFHTLCNMLIQLYLFENSFFVTSIIKPWITVKSETLHKAFKFDTQSYNPLLVTMKKYKCSFNLYCTILFILTHDITLLIYVHNFIHIIVIWVNNVYINDMQWMTM